MLSGVMPEIDQPRGGFDNAQGGLDNIFRRRDKRDHRAIVIRIGVTVKNCRALNRFNNLRQALDRFALAALAKVWYTLNQTICDF